MAWPHAPGRLNRCGDIDADGAAEEQTLLPEQVVDRLQGVLIVDPNRVIHRSPLQVRRHATVTNALGNRVALAAEFATGGPAVEGAAMGIGQDTAQLRLLLLQVERNAGIGPTCAGGRHPSIHLAAGLLPDLRTRGLVVVAAVGDFGMHTSTDAISTAEKAKDDPQSSRPKPQQTLQLMGQLCRGVNELTNKIEPPPDEPI